MVLKMTPALQQLIDALVEGENHRVTAKAPAKKTGSATKPKITFSGIPDKSEWNPAPAGSKDSGKNKKGPSNFHRLLDIIDRPLNAVEGAIVESADHKGLAGLTSFASGFGKGIAGKHNYTGREIVDELGMKGRGRGTAGFALDVALDPLNLIGSGAFKAAGKALGIGGKAVAEAVSHADEAHSAINAIRPVGSSVHIATGASKERAPLVATTKSFGKASKRPVVTAPVIKAAATEPIKPVKSEQLLDYMSKYQHDLKAAPGTSEARRKQSVLAMTTGKTDSVGGTLVHGIHEHGAVNDIPLWRGLSGAHATDMGTLNVGEEITLPIGGFSSSEKTATHFGTPVREYEPKTSKLLATHPGTIFKLEPGSAKVLSLADTAVSKSHNLSAEQEFLTAGNFEVVGKDVLPSGQTVVTLRASDRQLGKIEDIGKEAVTPIQVVEAISKVKPKDVPAPTLKKWEELPEKVRKATDAGVVARAAREWPNTELARKMGKGHGPIAWEKVDINAMRRSSPEFRAWFDPIIKSERDRALAAVHAKQIAGHAELVAALDKAAPLATPAEQVIKAAEGLPDVLKAGHQQLAESVASTHLANHGMQALTPVGQAKLRQSIANKYYSTRPNFLKGSAKANASINKIYKEAERLIAEPGKVPFAEGIPKLSDIIDDLPADVLADASKMSRALTGADVKNLATQAASELPKEARKTYVAGILKALKETGNATEVAQTRNIPVAEIKFRTDAEIAKDVGLVTAPKLPLPTKQTDKVLRTVAEYASRAPEWLNRRFNAAYGQTSWEHSAIRMGENSVNTAKEHDINFIRRMIRGQDKGAFNAAFLTAQAGGTGGKATEIADYFDKLNQLMKNAGVSEQEFMAKLRKAPLFKPKMVNGKRVKMIDETQGFEAWKTTKLEGQHAAKTMAYYADVAHNATLDSMVAGQLGNLFGAVKITDKALFEQAVKDGYKTVGDAPSLQGIVFPPEYTERLGQLLDSLGAKGNRADGFFKQYDKVLGLYKTGLTKYLPSHHVNNDIGQKYMAWLDGLTNPAWYTRAIKVMAHSGAADSAVATAGRTTVRLKNGITLDEAAIMKHFEDAGLRPSFAGIADLAGEEPKFKGAIPAAVDRFSQAREVHNRLAHFMFALTKEKGSVEDVVHQAAMRVQKHHADYGDLTEFERKVMRRVIPFYTWQRKVAPTLLRQAALNPGKIMVYPKFQQNLNQHFGIKPDVNNPFPGMSMIPSFMTEGTQAIYGKHNGNPVLGAFRTPFDDIVGKQFNHPLGNTLDQLTPAVKIPYELKSGLAIGNSEIHTLTKSQDRATYLENNTPLLSVLMRLTRRDPLHGFAPTKSAPDEQGMNWTALVNLLTAGGVKEDTSRFQEIAKKENATPKKRTPEQIRAAEERKRVNG